MCPPPFHKKALRVDRARAGANAPATNTHRTRVQSRKWPPPRQIRFTALRNYTLRHVRRGRATLARHAARKKPSTSCTLSYIFLSIYLLNFLFLFCSPRIRLYSALRSKTK